MNILITIAIVLVAVWAAGFILHILGGLIHILLLIALALIIYHFIRRRAAI